ncbi:MAG TPA: ScyD/ScyE family protein [Coleofasciculaceae cyanobacterium]|jgi:phospholipase/lecithinase/hemolysin
MDETLNEQASPTNAALGGEDVISGLPAQYSEGNAGFFNRQNEAVPTAVTVGPDGAIYASELSALPYPEGYARVLRVGDPEGDASYDGETPGGTSQIYASGFEQLNGLTFDEDGALYGLEYENASTLYDPALSVEDLPPSQLIRVDPDGTRQQISGEELRFANYVLAHEGKVYAAINNGNIDEGQVLAYEQDAETGEWSHEVVAKNLKNPRGMDIGPDGNLYVLESGEGTPADDPNVEDALSVEFIPGLVSQRAGYTGAISRIDLENGGQERLYEGLPSTIEYDPNTGEDRILSIGPNGLAIGEDGTAWIASGGGLTDETADALGEFGEGLRGVLKLEGLFDEDPSQATWTPTFDAVEYAGENGPDGATTLFNTQSNLNDIEIGPDGNLYAVDAARNVLYSISPDGEEVESVTVLQKTPPVLTPPQYGLVTEAGGDPSADYRVEVVDRTFKGDNELPDTPGRQQALANEAMTPAENGIDSELPSEVPGEAPSTIGEMPDGAPSEALSTTGEATNSPSQQDSPIGESANGNSEPPLRGEDAAIGGILGEEQPSAGNEDSVNAGQITADRPTPGNPMLEPQAPADGLPVPEADAGEGIDLPDDAEVLVATNPDGSPTEVPGFDPTMPPPDDFNANDFDPLNPGALPGVEQSVLIPGPVDPTAPAVTEGNPFADYFDPFFGVYSPAEGEEPMLPDGEDSYTVDDLFVFGDRLTENGGEFGKNSVAESTGANPPYDDAPYSPDGNFTDGKNWTTYLEDILGVEDNASQDTNFSYLDATARELENPVDPFGQATELNTFAGQIDTFEQTYGTFDENDLVVVNFGGNDLTLPPAEGVAPEEAAQQSIQATVDGIADLQELGAENFLVGLVPPVELAPIFSDQEFLDLLGVEPGFFDPVVEQYNQGLTTALETYEAESGANVEILDVNGLFDSIAAEPGAYGFVNVDEPVLSSQTAVTGEPIEYNEAIAGEDPAVQHATLFLDPYFHPTALGHSIIAETARDELLDLGNAVPEETGMTVGLYDTHEDTLIAPLKNGTQIQASEIAGKNLTISASVPEDSAYSEQVESVFLNLNDGQVTRTENVDPYAVFGDNGGDYFKAGIDLQGENTIAFEMYSQDELGGEMLGSMNINFSVV